MKRKFVVVAAALAVLAAHASSSLYAGPTIKFRETILDFGTLPQGRAAELRFEFENIGDQTLRILEIIPSCGCTSTTLAKRDYAPGEKGAIAVQFNSTGYQGKVVKTVVVRTNDPLQTSVNLTLAGTVSGEAAARAEFLPAQAKPDRLEFGKVKVGKSYVKRISLVNPGSRGLRLIEVQHLPDLHLLFLGKSKTLAAKGACEVDVVLQPLEPGPLVTLLKIRTNDNQNPYILVRIEAQAE